MIKPVEINMPPLRNKRALLRKHIHLILRHSLLIWMLISHMATSSSKGNKINLSRPDCMIVKDRCQHSTVTSCTKRNGKVFNLGDSPFLSCSLYTENRQHRPQRLIWNVSELLKNWSTMVFLPKTKNCQAAACWNHFRYTKDLGSLQQREPREA